MATVAQELMTAEQYALLPDNGLRTELVKGKVITLNPPTPKHGVVCARFIWFLMNHVEEKQLGRVVGNDSAVITTHDPDSVRGADVAYYSNSGKRHQPVPDGYMPGVPELIVEVRSPSDRWPKVLAKVAEYLEAGVTIVCVADPNSKTVNIYRNELLPQLLTEDQDFTLPELFPDFRVPVRKFFE